MLPKIVVVFQPTVMQMVMPDGTVVSEVGNLQEGMQHMVPPGAQAMAVPAAAQALNGLPAREQKIITLHEQGMRAGQIAKEVGVNWQLAMGVIRRHKNGTLGKPRRFYTLPGKNGASKKATKWKIPRRRYSSGKVKRLLWNDKFQRVAEAMVKSGMPKKDIAKKLGCNAMTITRNVKAKAK